MFLVSLFRDRIKALILRPRQILRRDVLIEKLEKFTTQKGGRNAAVEELLRRPQAAAPVAAPVRILPQ